MHSDISIYSSFSTHFVFSVLYNVIPVNDNKSIQVITDFIISMFIQSTPLSHTKISNKRLILSFLEKIEGSRVKSNICLFLQKAYCGVILKINKH